MLLDLDLPFSLPACLVCFTPSCFLCFSPHETQTQIKVSQNTQPLLTCF